MIWPLEYRPDSACGSIQSSGVIRQYLERLTVIKNSVKRNKQHFLPLKSIWKRIKRCLGFHCNEGIVAVTAIQMYLFETKKTVINRCKNPWWIYEAVCFVYPDQGSPNCGFLRLSLIGLCKKDTELSSVLSIKLIKRVVSAAVLFSAA